MSRTSSDENHNSNINSLDGNLGDLHSSSSHYNSGGEHNTPSSSLRSDLDEEKSTKLIRQTIKDKENHSFTSSFSPSFPSSPTTSSSSPSQQHELKQQQEQPEPFGQLDLRHHPILKSPHKIKKIKTTPKKKKTSKTTESKKEDSIYKIPEANKRNSYDTNGKNNIKSSLFQITTPTTTKSSSPITSSAVNDTLGSTIYVENSYNGRFLPYHMPSPSSTMEIMKNEETDNKILPPQPSTIKITAQYIILEKICISLLRGTLCGYSVQTLQQLLLLVRMHPQKQTNHDQNSLVLLSIVHHQATTQRFFYIVTTLCFMSTIYQFVSILANYRHERKKQQSHNVTQTTIRNPCIITKAQQITYFIVVQNRELVICTILFVGYFIAYLCTILCDAISTANKIQIVQYHDDEESEDVHNSKSVFQFIQIWISLAVVRSVSCIICWILNAVL